MKNRILVYILLISSIPFNSWAQKNILNEKKIGESQTNSPIQSDQIDTPPARKIKYYHVEEVYDLKSGGHKTTYNVSDPKLIQTYDLGPNNKRIITPVYRDPIVETVKKSDPSKRIKNPARLAIANTSKKTDPSDLESGAKTIATPALAQKEKLDESAFKSDPSNTIKNSTQLAIADPSRLEPDDKNIITPALAQKEKLVENAFKLGSSNTIKNSAQLVITDTPKKVDTSAYIDIIKTYEGVAEKGYETLDILKKLGNSYFFDNELEKAEKYYTKLFRKTTDLEPEYYYRYSVALKSIGQIEKSKEFFKKFNQLSGNSSR
ncbi:tetratricopeptide repeat protein [Flavobacterium laiguense]|uniref:Uncharacterized protein n=1 Tax=Flavobacterium laiguense TaxID=2169409 RepID=A0A2U1JWC0_9FLAO|nr:hypothetical protein [Flavobacterium laiguense]PWA09123.1 hypothetical protein DB891_09285 [Flavobacterium laiguense]